MSLVSFVERNPCKGDPIFFARALYNPALHHGFVRIDKAKVAVMAPKICKDKLQMVHFWMMMQVGLEFLELRLTLTHSVKYELLKRVCCPIKVMLPLKVRKEKMNIPTRN